MASSARWKRHERETAAQLGGVRVPCNGSSNVDIRVPGFSVQHKTRKALPAWFNHAVEQAVRDCEEGQTPMVTLAESPGKGHKTKRYVVLRVEDWIDWHGREREI